MLIVNYELQSASFLNLKKALSCEQKFNNQMFSQILRFSISQILRFFMVSCHIFSYFCKFVNYLKNLNKIKKNESYKNYCFVSFGNCFLHAR